MGQSSFTSHSLQTQDENPSHPDPDRGVSSQSTLPSGAAFLFRDVIWDAWDSINTATNYFIRNLLLVVGFCCFVFWNTFLPQAGVNPLIGSLIRGEQRMKLRCKSLLVGDDGSLIHLPKWLRSHLLFNPSSQMKDTKVELPLITWLWLQPKEDRSKERRACHGLVCDLAGPEPNSH